jgi:hypothetical protein
MGREMRVVLANCRIQFTAEDIAFILEVLQPEVESHASLLRLLADEETRDQVLDDDSLFRAVLERRGCLRISPHFYFYVLVRQVLRRSGLEDRNVADYVAEVLAEYSRAESERSALPGQIQPLDYFIDALAALRSVDDSTAFSIRAHIGNRTLFLSGVLANHLRHRTARRAAPGLEFYEELGRESYRLASDHRLARKYDLVHVYRTLADDFHSARMALNDLGDRLLALGDEAFSVQGLLNSAFKFGVG